MSSRREPAYIDSELGDDDHRREHADPKDGGQLCGGVPKRIEALARLPVTFEKCGVDCIDLTEMDPKQQALVSRHAAAQGLRRFVDKLARRLPRHPSLPAYRIGRLAVDRGVRGQKLGAALLADALCRALQAEAATVAMLVDATDDQAGTFYRHNGFLGLSGRLLAWSCPFHRG